MLASRRFLKALLVAQHAGGKLAGASAAAISATSLIDPDVHVLIAGHGADGDNAAKDAAQYKGVKGVIKVSSPEYEYEVPEDMAKLVVDTRKSGNFSLVTAAHTAFGRGFLARAAMLEDVSMISDIIKVLDSTTFMRAPYAGSVTAKAKTSQPLNYISVRPTMFTTPEGGGSAPVTEGKPSGSTGLSKSHGPAVTKPGNVDLGAAKVVVSGGRGLKNGDNFKILRELAAKIPQCAVGATRAVVDAGFVPNDMQVGQTGRIVAPNLYLAFGLSGAIQHTAGMKDSKVIACVNTDPEAPIFQISDYGLVGDLFEVLPKLTKMVGQ